VLRERATELVQSVIGIKPAHEQRKFILEGLKMCVSHGLTSVQTNDSSSYDIYKSLRDENMLNIRVFLTPNHQELSTCDIKPINYLSSSHIKCTCDDQDNCNCPNGYSPNAPMTYLSVDRVKLYSDGSLGAETAAIRVGPSYDESNTEIVSDKPYKGILIQSEDVLTGLIRSAKDKGFRLEIHAIGDAAAEQVMIYDIIIILHIE
jgi:predicted amidohydrolase YtcJ